jgi:hypothetical protein
MKTTSIHPTTESAVKHDRGQSRAWLGYAQSAVCCYMNTTYISFIFKKKKRVKKCPVPGFHGSNPHVLGGSNSPFRSWNLESNGCDLKRS